MNAIPQNNKNSMLHIKRHHLLYTNQHCSRKQSRLATVYAILYTNISTAVPSITLQEMALPRNQGRF